MSTPKRSKKHQVDLDDLEIPASRSRAADIVKESLKELHHDVPPGQEDLVLDLGRDTPDSGAGYVGAVRGATSRGVMDKLLIGVRAGQGDYLKLYRNMGGGQYELKHRWDAEWETWTDLEVAVMNFVRDMTKKYGAARWGSGNYRVRVGRGPGHRGPEDPPVDFWIDALEEVVAPTQVGQPSVTESLGSTIGMFTSMAQAMKSLQPETKSGTDPMMMMLMAKMLDRKDEAVSPIWGLVVPAVAPLLRDLVIKQGGPQEHLQMIDRVMSIVKNASPPATPPTTLAQQVAELKLLGIDPFEKKSLTSAANELSSVLSVIKGLGGQLGLPGAEGAAEPSMTKIIADNLGGILNTINNVLSARQTELAPATGAALTNAGATTSPSPPGLMLPPGTHPALAHLLRAVMAQDEGAFPSVSELVQGLPNGRMILQDIQGARISPQDLLDLIRLYTKGLPGIEFLDHPQIQPALTQFLRGYFEVMQGRRVARTGSTPMTAPLAPLSPGPTPQSSDVGRTGAVVGKCDGCGKAYDYPTQSAYDAETAQNGNRCGEPLHTTGRPCPGVVLVVTTEVSS